MKRKKSSPDASVFLTNKATSKSKAPEVDAIFDRFFTSIMSRRFAATLTLILLTTLQFKQSYCQSNQEGQCPSSHQLKSLVAERFQDSVECYCSHDPSHAPEGWDISCMRRFRPPTTASSQSDASTKPPISKSVMKKNKVSESEDGFDMDAYSTVESTPFEFTIKHESKKVVEISCYDSSPDFKPAMFQGFGIDEADKFTLINCTLPQIPLSVVLHRTSITSLDGEDPVENNPTTPSPSDSDSDYIEDSIKKSTSLNTREVVSEVKLLKIEYPEARKFTIAQLATLFNGFESLQKLTLHNVVLEVSPSSSTRNLDTGTRSVAPRVFVSRAKRETQFEKFTLLDTGTTQVFGQTFRPTPIPFPSSDRINIGTNSRRNMVFTPTAFSFPVTTTNDPTTTTTKPPTTTPPVITSSSTSTRNPETVKPFVFSYISSSPQFVNVSNKPELSKDKTIAINEDDDDLETSSQTFGADSIKFLNFKFSSFFPKLENLLLDSFLTLPDRNNGFYVKEITSDLNNLETLQLRSNNIPKLPGAFLPPSLKRLYLIKNSIKTLDANSFLNLRQLQSLDLSQNELKKLPEYIFRDLQSLESLNLGKNYFKSLPENLLSSTPLLRTLDLSSNKNLTLLPQSLLVNSQNLETIKASDCNLRDISADPSSFFKGASSLQTIELRGNHLRNLTAFNVFGQNPRLRRINLSYNDIQNISPAVFSTNSSSITELNLHANDLLAIDQLTLNNLRSLSILKLGFNNLTSMSSDSLLGLKKLEELDLSKNFISSFNPTRSKIPFSPSVYLRKVNLSGNNLTNFNEFRAIDWTLYLKISEINLSNNKLEGDVILPVLYSTAPQVVINLASNLITTIVMDDVIAYESVVLAALKDEKLSSESKWKPNGGRSLSQIIVHLDNNPLSCDCFLEPFVKYARSSAEDVQAALRGLNRLSFNLSPDLKCASTMQPVFEVDIATLSCPLSDSKLCPSALGCTCIYRSSNNHVMIDCSNKGLKKVPENLLNSFNYRNISLVKQAPLSSSPSNEVRLTTSNVETVTLDLSNNEISRIDTLSRLLQIPSSSKNKNNGHNRRLNTNQLKGISFELFLDNNRVSFIPDNFLQVSEPVHNPGLPATQIHQSNIIKLLSLKNNKLSKLPLSFLDYLDASANNSLAQRLPGDQVIPSSLALKSAKIYLGDNPFNCTPEKITYPPEVTDCSSIYFKTWLVKDSPVQDVSNIKCSFLSTNQTEDSPRSLIEIPDTDLCPQLAFADESGLFALSVICIILSILLVIVCILYYKNKQTVLAFIYIHVNPVFVCLNFTESDIDEDKLYDAFISYSSADRDIVTEMIEKLERPSDETVSSISFLKQQQSVGVPSIHEGKSDQIVPELTHSPPSKKKSQRTGRQVDERIEPSKWEQEEEGTENYFNLCIHERDWLPGNLISWNIVNSVQNSRRTVLILSEEFIKSIWFQIEFHTAYYQMLEDKMDRLIVVVRGELPPKEEMDKDLVFLLTTKTYLVWGEKWFWEKLRYALPHKSGRRKQIMPMSDTNNKTSTLDMNVSSKNKKNKSISSIFSSSGAALSSTLKLNGANPAPHRQSKSDLMKEYVDQTIADHFQLQASKFGSQQTSTPKVVTQSSTDSKAKSNSKSYVNDSFVVETET